MDTSFDRVRSALALLPDWAISCIVFAAAIIFALAVHALVFRLLRRATDRLDLFWRSLVARTRGPLLLGFLILAIIGASPFAPLGDMQASVMRHVFWMALIALFAWLASTALHIGVTVYLRRFKLDSDDNLLARKHITQTRIMRRVADTIIIVVAIGAALTTFDAVRQYGVSLLASAGAAGIIIGLALQTVLRNIFAGIQLAITQPIRIDDVVMVAGERGKVEEITST